MAKISIVLVFSVLLALPFHSVLGQDDSWKDLLGGGLGGLSQETLDEAKKALGGADPSQVANAAAAASGAAAGASQINDLLGAANSAAGTEGATLSDWVSAAKSTGSAPAPAAASPDYASEPEADLLTDEVGDIALSPAGAPTSYAPKQAAPAKAPTANAPKKAAPATAPTANAPKQAAPAKAPKQAAPAKAPTSNAPKQAPAKAPMANAPKQSAPAKAPISYHRKQAAPANAPTAEAPEAEEESDWAPEEAPEAAPSGSPLADGNDDEWTANEPADAPTESAEGAALDGLFQGLD